MIRITVCFNLRDKYHSLLLLMINNTEAGGFKITTHPKYLLGLVIITILLLAIQWYLAATIIFIQSLLIIRRKKKVQKANLTKKIIDNYPWGELHRIVRDSLELLKFTKMIERGYDSKTNTNIILQEEKQQSSTFEISIDEKMIISSQIAIIKVLQELSQAKRALFEEQRQGDIIEPIFSIASFKELFAANRAADLLIQQFWELSGLLRARMQQPLLDQSIRHELVIKCQLQILPLLSELTKKHHHLEQTMKERMQALKLKPQYQQYLDLFTSNTYKEKQLQALMSQIEQFQQKEKERELQLPISNNYTILQNERKQETAVKIQKNIHTEQSATSQRKQFMKKLDAQLTMGLARRRQQEFEKRMKALEQSESISS